MTTSPLTYDILVDYTAADAPVARELAHRLRLRGLRPRLNRSRADDRERLTRSARMTARVIGRSGAEVLPQCDAQMTILAPECRLSPPHVVDGVVVDFRRGFDGPRAWSRVRDGLTEASTQAGCDPQLRLAPAALKQSVIESYDRIAEKFTARWFDHPPLSALEKFMRRLPRRALVLDAGCGPGHHARFIARSGHQVVGIDLSNAMLGIARRAVASATFHRMDIQALQFTPRTFDGIWCAAAVMHVAREDVVALFRGYRAMIRPGGIVAINVQVGRDSEIVEYGDDRRFFEYYRDIADVACLVSRAGLVPVDFDYGEVTRNTHELDLTLKWGTVYGVRGND